MQTVSVRTTQNVFIQYPVASIGDRILAYLVDIAIVIAYFIVIGFVMDGAGVDSIALVLTILFLPYLLYHLLFEIFMNGQSPGKKALSIKVVRMDGTPPTIGNYILRWVLRIVEIDMFSGGLALLTIAINGKGQRIGDLAADTTVVKIIPQREVTAKEVFTMAEDNYIPTFQQVMLLTDKDIELIQRALEVNRTTGNNKPALAVSEKIMQLLGVQPDMPPVKFLYTVVKDYSHISSGK